MNFVAVVAAAAAAVAVDDDVVVALFCDLDLEYAYGLGEGLVGGGEMLDAGGGADMGEGEVVVRALRFCDWGHGEN